jgi:polyhydroxyalkanoate synthesis regulator phasin
MFELLEKTLLAGVGALALTQQKVEELVSELQQRFNLAEDKSRDLLARLSEATRSNQQKLEQAAREEVQKVCTDLGLVNHKDLARLEKKLRALEKQLKELRKTGTDKPSAAC